MGRPKFRAARGDAKRQDIILEAARVLGAKGYNGTTLSDIAQAAGVQTGSLYYYFSSRDDLIEEVLKASMTVTADRVRLALEQTPGDAPTIERIRRGIRAHLGTIVS